MKCILILIFNFLGHTKTKKYGPGSKLWEDTAKSANTIIAAWGDLPTIPSENELKKLSYVDAGLKKLTNSNRIAWRATWIPKINERKKLIAQWLNNNRKTGNFPPIGYLGRKTRKNNPKHPLYLSKNILVTKANVPFPT